MANSLLQFESSIGAELEAELEADDLNWSKEVEELKKEPDEVVKKVEDVEKVEGVEKDVKKDVKKDEDNNDEVDMENEETPELSLVETYYMVKAKSRHN